MSTEDVEASRTPGVSTDSLRQQYTEICASHNGITDFRAKLLSLLPIASGAGLIVLGQNVSRPIMTPIGLYGVAVTLGLFVYELRGIRNCKRLREQAAHLEEALAVPAGMGQFRDRLPAALGGLIGAEGASWTVYLAVITGWIYLAGVGRDWWRTLSPWVLAALYVVVIIVAAAWQLNDTRRKSGRPAREP